MTHADNPVDETLLASLLCSRLCHDLLSPVGGMLNGVELLAAETEPAMRDQCIDLLAQGARRASAKLQFFRLAFGTAGGFGSHLPAADLQAAVDAVAAEARDVTINWALAATDFPKDAAKVLVNLALLAIEALPRGGSVAIVAEASGNAHEIALRTEGQKVVFPAAIGQALDGLIPVAELEAHTAPAMLIRLIVERNGGRLQHQHDGNTLLLGAVVGA
ncbi:histidine phosphotransferase family protein [Croceicoccus sp. F390]|uniref:Histidine phosphotransferase family protein n=1 Tax=Croceicoccus esteveae TaxID=3075597 RepID=A0ABU2ZDF3_9SPHN|nr:histidine phosphotransferase family protein [Croceicoccus sp. F390]MDT0574625.1 histidine phosphotransferase family protein [Croceicoccus sp. F390]